jgi:uncharacterized protein (DUF1501 family)
VGLAGYAANGETYGNAANYSVSPPTYSANDSGRTLKALDVITKLTRMKLGGITNPNNAVYHYQHHLEEGYNEIMKRARDNEDVFGAALEGSTAEIDNAFDLAFGWDGVSAQRPELPEVALQLKMVARLVKGRSVLENKRQIFFVSMEGFDTHQNQPEDHDELLEQLDNSLKGFKDAIEAVGAAEGNASGLWNDTLLFTNSDFARTLQPNGDETGAGTDHGWGGHQIVMGGAVIGQRIYGSFPNLARGTGQDVDEDRGRWIPTTAVDQYASVVARWFMSQGSSYVSGLTSEDLSTIFPNLGRFQSVSTIPSELGFIDFTV